MKPIICFSLFAALALAVLDHSAVGQKAVDLKGTWTGTSTCVGYRPACKNEIVVYRFVPVDGHPAQLRLLGDKIIDGKRVPNSTKARDVRVHRVKPADVPPEPALEEYDED